MISKCIRRLSFRSLADHGEGESVRDNNRDSSPCLPAPVAMKPSWTSCLWDKMASTSPPPRDLELSFAMKCTVFLQESHGTYIISVVMHRATRQLQQHGCVIASSAVSANVHTGEKHYKHLSPLIIQKPNRSKENNQHKNQCAKIYVT